MGDSQRTDAGLEREDGMTDTDRDVAEDWREAIRLLHTVNLSLDNHDGHQRLEIELSLKEPGAFHVVRHLQQFELIDASIAEVRDFLEDSSVKDADTL
jgi:hypothetical protein